MRNKLLPRSRRFFHLLLHVIQPMAKFVAIGPIAFVMGLNMMLGLSAEARTQVDRILAIVNDEIVTQSDLKSFVEKLKSGGLVDDQLVPDDATKQSLLKSESAALQKLIDARILDGEVRRQGLSIPVERVEQEIRSIAKRNRTNRDGLREALTGQGIDFAEYQDFLKTGLERQALVEKSVTSKIKISEDDVVAAFMAEGKSAESQAFEYSLAHILFLSSRGGADAAKKRGAEALQKLKEGAPWDRVAADFSEDPGFELGGVLGTFKSGELSADLEKAISQAKLSPGDYLPQLLPAQGGFHIVRLTRRKLIPDPKIEKEKDRIRGMLGERAFRRQYDAWLEQLRSEAFIRVNK